MRILGIDVGSSSIKAVELDSAFGRFDIHDYHELTISSAPTSEGTSELNLSDAALQETIHTLVSQLAKAPDRIIVALPQKTCTFRNLQLPTRDKKAIQSGIRFELEDDLPFSLENAAYDYSIINQTKQGSLIHVVATLRTHLISALNFWKASEVEPDLITSQSWAYRTFFNRLIPIPHEEHPILFVSMGSDSTTFYAHWKGTPILIREMNWGGQNLTKAIAQKLQVSEPQAESIKLDQGVVSIADGQEDITPEQKEISQCLRSALEPFLSELRRVEIASKSLTRHKLKTLYLGGGSSLLPGLTGLIEKNLGTPTQLLPALSSITTSGVTYSEQTDARFVLALSLALCLVGADRTGSINFRKGDFSKEGRTREINFKVLKKPLIAISAVAASLFVSLIVQSAVYKSRLETTNSQLEKSVRSFFGQLSNSALKTYLANTSTLKSSLQKELNKQRELSRLYGPNPRSPLEFLKTLSNTVPKDTVVDLITFQTGVPPNEPFSTKEKSSSTLTFVISNPQTAEKLNNQLASKFEDFHKGKMEELSSAGDVIKKWKIVFTGKPIEEPYGK